MNLKTIFPDNWQKKYQSAERALGEAQSIEEALATLKQAEEAQEYYLSGLIENIRGLNPAELTDKEMSRLEHVAIVVASAFDRGN